MDISKLNPQAAADTAQRLVIVNPYDGEPLKDESGEEMAVHVMGMQSTAARNTDAKHRREAPKPEKPVEEMAEEEKQAFLETIQEFGRKAGAEKLAAMISGLEGNWEHGGKSVKTGSKELRALMESQDWLADQVIAFAKRIENYRPKI